MKRSRIGAEEFIRAWQVAENLDEVSTKIAKDIKYTSSRASRLRKKGVSLKKFTGGSGARVNYAKLDALAKELVAE